MGGRDLNETGQQLGARRLLRWLQPRQEDARAWCKRGERREEKGTCGGGGLNVLGPQGRKRREYGAGAFKEQEVEWILDVVNLWDFGAGGNVG